MGGKKTITYRDIQSSNVFPDDFDLFRKQLVNYYFYTKDSFETIKALVGRANLFFNIKLLKKLGLVKESVINVSYVESGSVKEYLRTNVSDKAELVNFYTKECVDKEYSGICSKYPLNIDYAFIFRFLNDNYEKDERYDFSVGYIVCANSDCTETYSISVNLDAYIYIIDDKKYKIDSYSVNEDLSYKVKLKNIDDENDVIEIDTPINRDKGVLVEYRIGLDLYRIIIFYSDLILSSINYQCLIFSLKHDSELIVDDKLKMRAFSNKFGFSKEFYEQIGDETIKELFVTYATSLKDDKYSNILQEVYEPDKEIVIQNDYHKVTYFFTRCGDDSAQSVFCDAYYLEINEYKKLINSEDNLFIIPINVLDKKTLKDKYEFVSKYTKFFSALEEKKEVSFWQTDFFQALMTFAQFVVAISTGNPTVVLATIGTNIALSTLDLSPEMKFVIAVASIAVGSYGSVATTTTQATINYAKLAIQMTNAYFSYKTEKIYEKIYELKKETDEYREIIDKIKGQFIYSPLEYTNNYYSIIYKLPFMQYRQYNIICNPKYLMKGVMNYG